MLATLVVSLAVLTALVARAWDAAWDSKVAGPIPPILHRALTYAQAGAVLAVALVPSVGFLVMAAIYAAMAVGVTALRARGSRGECGCFGSTLRMGLGARLVVLDITLSILALIVAVSASLRPTAGDARIGLVGSALVATFLALVLGPGRRLIVEARAMATPYRRAVMGYVDVPEAPT